MTKRFITFILLACLTSSGVTGDNSELPLFRLGYRQVRVVMVMMSLEVRRGTVQ